MVTECTGNIDSVYQFDPHTHVTYSYSSVYTFKLFIGLLKGKCLHPVLRLVNWLINWFINKAESQIPGQPWENKSLPPPQPSQQESPHYADIMTPHCVTLDSMPAFWKQIQSGWGGEMGLASSMMSNIHIEQQHCFLNNNTGKKLLCKGNNKTTCLCRNGISEVNWLLIVFFELAANCC